MRVIHSMRSIAKSLGFAAALIAAVGASSAAVGQTGSAGTAGGTGTTSPAGGAGTTSPAGGTGTTGPAGRAGGAASANAVSGAGPTQTPSLSARANAVSGGGAFRNFPTQQDAGVEEAVGNEGFGGSVGQSAASQGGVGGAVATRGATAGMADRYPEGMLDGFYGEAYGDDPGAYGGRGVRQAPSQLYNEAQPYNGRQPYNGNSYRYNRPRYQAPGYARGSDAFNRSLSGRPGSAFRSFGDSSGSAFGNRVLSDPWYHDNGAWADSQQWFNGGSYRYNNSQYNNFIGGAQRGGY